MDVRLSAPPAVPCSNRVPPLFFSLNAGVGSTAEVPPSLAVQHAPMLSRISKFKQMERTVADPKALTALRRYPLYCLNTQADVDADAHTETASTFVTSVHVGGGLRGSEGANSGSWSTDNRS